MKLYEIYFSPTGGTKKAADILAEAWMEESGQTVRIDLITDKRCPSEYQFEAEDICIIAVPAYGGRVPRPALDKLRQMKGNDAQAILMAVYGNRAIDDTMLELKDILCEAGFVSVAGISAVAEHSIVREFAAGRPDEEDREELCGFVKAIKTKLESGGKSAADIPGNRPYREFGGVGMIPKANDYCNGCGICACNCPVQAISKDNLKEADESKCISCMRCIAVCPKRARLIDEAMVEGTRAKIGKFCAERKNNELFL